MEMDNEASGVLHWLMETDNESSGVLHWSMEMDKDARPDHAINKIK